MADCPLAEECPSFSERIEGLGCQHYGDRGGAEWCNHYDMPISDLKRQPVKIGEEVVVDVVDIHESGAGVGHTDDGFVVFIDGLLPEARARVKIVNVMSNHARAEVVERLPLEDDESDEPGAEADSAEETRATDSGPDRPPELGSREDFWGS
ncbi:MAG: TRAM domain-containing protein [Halobacteriales archaeon]